MHDRIEELANEEVYRRISRVASRARNRGGQPISISTGDIVQDAFIKILNAQDAKPLDEQHLLALLAKSVRYVLLDYFKTKNRRKRDALQVTLSHAEGELVARSSNVVLIHEILLRLEAIDQQKARIVELRYFGGLTLEETAETLDISVATVKRSWLVARGWLIEAIESERRLQEI